MDLQKEREVFEESNNVKPDWSFKFDVELQQYIALDSEMELQVDEFNELWDAFRAGWQAAKAQAVPDGFVLVEREKLAMIFETATNALVYHATPPKHDALSIIQGIARKAMIEEQEPAQ